MQLMLEDPKLAASLGVEPPTGMLLYGPPGTGKTTIARVLASEARCQFFATSPAEINSMWLGESEKQVKRLFDQARAAAPSIIFLDEIDALLPSRTGGVNQYSDKVVNQFLHEMDGLRANKRVFVVGATNRRDMLDPALLRGGRLSREIEIPLPDIAGRRDLFELYMRAANMAPDVAIEDLAQRSEGLSGANIRALINEAGLQALIRIADDPAADRHVTNADFDEALANVNAQQQDKTDDLNSQFWRMAR
jgi:transitional endoplasmic reticulum ATPase